MKKKRNERSKHETHKQKTYVEEVNKKKTLEKYNTSVFGIALEFVCVCVCAEL